MTILVVDDDATQRLMLGRLLQKQLGYHSCEASHGGEALAQLKADKAQRITTVLLDLEMPHMDGRAALPQIVALRPDVAIIVVTGTNHIQDVVDVMHQGATDFLLKPVQLAQLKTALAKAGHWHALRHTVQQLERAEAGHSRFHDIIGYDGDLRQVVKLANRAAQSDITVLMTGESGVGKEVLARAIHGESMRAGKPFIAINCGAIPRELVESTLFGHKKGSFTGAIQDANGKFREAEGGTLFLDEVGELPLDAQVKLLRALQAREIEPVGMGKAVPVNIRVIAATNRTIAQEVQRGTFRADLFYRLNVFPIAIPALRERKQDLPILAEHFVQHYAALENKRILGLSSDAQAWLLQHPWHGNVRELENLLYRAVLLCDQEQITPEHLPLDAMALQPVSTELQSHRPTDEPVLSLFMADGSLKSFAALEEEIFTAAMLANQNNVVKAAQALRIGKSTLYRWQQQKEDRNQ